MRVLIGALLALHASVAAAKELSVTDQEQQAISQICEAASLSPAQNLEARVAIGQWCLTWKRRMETNNQRPEAPAPPAQPDK